MGDAVDIVNAGVTVLHLVANSAGTHNANSYANGLPSGTEAHTLSGWQGPTTVKVTYAQNVGDEWYHFWNVTWDFDVMFDFMHHGRLHDKGLYVDQITPAIDVRHLPPDFTLSVTANFPHEGLNHGSDDDPLAALNFTMIVELKGMLGQLVSSTRTFHCTASGDGNWAMA
jgi:hypothetical protein